MHHERPLLVLFHGLEGSSGSHYAQAFAHWGQQNGCDIAVPHFRGCSGTLNLAPRAYHSGDHEEVHHLLVKFRQMSVAQKRPGLLAAGVSLGGNALMRWAGEQGQAAPRIVNAVASICSPLDLTASGSPITFATGALTTQRAVAVVAPTYAFVGDSTITDVLWTHYYSPSKMGTDTVWHTAQYPSALTLPVTEGA